MANGWSAEDVQKRQNSPKKWTVMVYFAGDNNLSEEMIYAIKEMYRVGVTGDVDVIVQFDPSAIGAPVRRYVISKEELVEDAKIPEIKAALAASISVQKVMVASASQALARSPRIEPCTARHSERKTDAIIGLDIDGNIIENLGIPLDGKTGSPKWKKTYSARPFSALPKRVRQLRDYENSADPEVLEQFITESISYFPSEHYLVVLSGHGSGALGDFLPDDNPSRPGEPLQSLSIPSLARVFKNVKGVLSKAERGNKTSIDILGMDSCLMSMAEIGYEVKDNVDVLVGSEGFVLNTGWPYHRILEALNLKSGIPPVDLAKEVVKKYISYYDDYEAAGASTDQSVCELKKLDTLVPYIQNLAAALKKGLGDSVLRDEIVLAHWEAQSYKTEQYTDLYDFCDRLQRRCLALEVLQDRRTAINKLELMRDTELSALIVKAFQKEKGLPVEDAKTLLEMVIKLIQTSEEVKQAIGSVVNLSCYTGPAFQHSHGLSVYFPWSESKEDLDKYQLLTFAKSGWGEFLKRYVVETRRPEKRRSGEKREGRFNPNPNNEIVETLLLVRVGTSGNPKGPASTGSAKNPPVNWVRGKCGKD